MHERAAGVLVHQPRPVRRQGADGPRRPLLVVDAVGNDARVGVVVEVDAEQPGSAAGVEELGLGLEARQSVQPSYHDHIGQAGLAFMLVQTISVAAICESGSEYDAKLPSISQHDSLSPRGRDVSHRAETRRLSRSRKNRRMSSPPSDLRIAVAASGDPARAGCDDGPSDVPVPFPPDDPLSAPLPDVSLVAPWPPDPFFPAATAPNAAARATMTTSATAIMNRRRFHHGVGGGGSDPVGAYGFV